MNGDNKDRTKHRRTAAQPLAQLLAALVDPGLQRKTGMTSGLVASWPEIAGVRLYEGCRPERLVWPSQRSGMPSDLDAATLVVACEPAFILRLQHANGELLARVNSFFGYRAVDRLKIVQSSIAPPRPSRKPVLRPLDTDDRRIIADATANIDNPRLKAALTMLGEGVLGRNAKPPR